MALIRYTFIVFSFAAIFTLPVAAQSPSDKTQAVYTVSKLVEKTESEFKKYERLKEGDRLMEVSGQSGPPAIVNITKSLRSELSQALGSYLKAIDSGWSASDPELSKARETIQTVQARMEEVGVWICFKWDEERLSDRARDDLDAIRLKAWEGTLIMKLGKVDAAVAAFAFARKLVDEHSQAIENQLDQGQDVVDTRKHPAFARTITEIDRLEASVKDDLGKVEGEREQLTQDIKALVAVSQKASPFLQEVRNFGSFSGAEDKIIEAADQFRKKIDAFESDYGSAVKDTLASFTNRYGSDRDAISASIARIMGSQSLQVPQSPQFLIAELNNGLDGIAESRKNMVEQLIEIGTRNSTSESADSARRKETFALAQSSLELALEIDPQNAEAKRILDGLSAGAAAAEELVEAKLAEGTWDDHSSVFQGPGSADSLAESAKEWLAADPGWTEKKDVIAVRINGDWVVAEKDRDGRPLTWGLPIEAAFIRHTDRDEGLDMAWVFRLTLVTRDNEKAPPWKASWVGGNRQMRASEIDGTGSGGPNPIFRLLLVLALVASGALLVGPFVTSRVPALSAAYALLTPLRPVIGVATLAVGVLLLVLSLLNPLSNLLPQAAAIVAGLFLGIELLLKKRPESDAPSAEDATSQAGRSAEAAVGKAQELLAGQAQNIRKIEGIQVPLGAACLVLALLHLVAGQITLL